jgi:hypothetical protein
MATLPKVLINRADYQIGGGVALRLRTQAPLGILVLNAVLDAEAPATGVDGARNVRGGGAPTSSQSPRCLLSHPDYCAAPLPATSISARLRDQMARRANRSSFLSSGRAHLTASAIRPLGNLVSISTAGISPVT